jgi:peptide/nickel transport system substrate-binding protein
MGTSDSIRRPAPGALGRRGFLAAGAGLAGAGLLAACSSNGTTKSHATVTAKAKPRRGGNLTLGLTGGSSADTINPGGGLSDVDYLRIFQLYQPLVWLDPAARVSYVLAESIEPVSSKNLDQWIIRVRPGITFHSGKALTAADVLYTFERIIKGKLSGLSPLDPVDTKNSKVLDTHTLKVQMTKPYGSFVDQLASVFAYLPIVPEGFSNPAKPDGTGPYVYQSFTPGQRSVFTRNPNYWKPGRPWTDTVTILDFSDSTTIQDALISGTIHGAGLLDGPQMAELGTRSGITIVPSKSGSLTPFTMRVDKAPFNDVRVRQAMRLLVDRPQIIDAGLDSYGSIASDVFSPYDPDFDHDLVRTQDIAQAKYLLKKAGQEDFKTTLVTSDVSTGMVSMATVLAQQATSAGVKINLQNVPAGTFFGPNYLQWEFSQDFYPYSTYLGQVAYSMLKTSPFNETHTNNAHYTNLFNQANATVDKGLRKEILFEMQKFDFNEGGYIIPAFPDALDAYSKNVGGYSTDCRQGNPLSNFAVEDMYFTA